MKPHAVLLLLVSLSVGGCPLQPSAAGKHARTGREDVSIQLHGTPVRSDAGQLPRGAAAPISESVDDSDDAGEPVRHNGQAVFTPELVNARDLGGTLLGAGHELAFHELYRGPPLSGLSSAGCAELSERGIRTVIDLRVPPEAAAAPESACVRDAARVEPAPLPIPYQVSPADYIAILDAQQSMAAVFRILGDDSAYPIYFHCTYGRDRTGVVAAVILAALGADRADILDEYELSLATVGGYPRSLAAALDELDRRGGVQNYLAQVGVTTEQLAVLRKHALASDSP